MISATKELDSLKTKTLVVCRFYITITRILMIVLAMPSLLFSQSTVPGVLSVNPYGNLDWKAINHFRANYHTHTTQSDGTFLPHEVVDFYHSAGYKILAITDHNQVTYPWTAFSLLDTSYQDRDPVLFGMLDVAGSELSASHHTGSLIGAVQGNGANFKDAMDSLSANGGLAIFYHPGIYWDIDSIYNSWDIHSVEWYEDVFLNYPVLVGMEVHNQGDRCPYDRVLWDELLTRMMPARPVWGYSNDDMHGVSHLFRNYNVMLMQSLTTNDLKTCMKQGTHFLSYEPSGTGSGLAPEIDSIVVDKSNRSISIYANNYSQIEWISGVAGQGGSRISNIINTGNVFFYNNFCEPYVRAVLIGISGITYTQPFGFDTIPPSKADTIYGPCEICEGMDSVEFQADYDELAEFYQWQLPQGAVIISGGGTNQIIVDFSGVTQSGQVSLCKANLHGVSDTVYLNFTIFPLSDSGTLSGGESICLGDTAGGLMLSGYTGTMLEWQYSPDGQVWYQAAVSIDTLFPGQVPSTTYYRVVVKNDVCDADTSNEVILIVNTLPAKPVISVTGSQLVSSYADGNQWYDHNGAIYGAVNQIFVPQQNGLYYVSVTDTNHCTSVPSDPVSVNIGLEEIHRRHFTIFPNPSSGVVVIRFGDKVKGSCSVKITSLNGSLMSDPQIISIEGEEDYRLDFSFLPDGFYLIEIGCNDANEVHSIILNR